MKQRYLLARSASIVLVGSFMLSGCAVGSAAPAASSSVGVMAGQCWKLQIAGQRLLGLALKVAAGTKVDSTELVAAHTDFEGLAKGLAASDPTRAAKWADQAGLADGLAAYAANVDLTGIADQAQALAGALAAIRCA